MHRKMNKVVADLMLNVLKVKNESVLVYNLGLVDC